MATLMNYDETNPFSIEAYARKLIGHTFKEVDDGTIVNDNLSTIVRDPSEAASYSNKARKGGLGNLIEEKYFGYKANSNQGADFSKAGVELKVTPYEKKKNGELKAGERLVITMISYQEPIEKEFFQSHLWDKCRLMLLIYYLRDKTFATNLEYRIDFVRLFSPPEEDLKIIEADYKLITEKIAAGKAHELSESDTMYLGACTKGATAEKSTVPQYYNPSVMARKRAYCFKNSYMTSILNEYLSKDVETYKSIQSSVNRIIPHTPIGERIIKDSKELIHKSFETIITERIDRYAGMTDKELCKLFKVAYNPNNKSLWIMLAYRMLGIKSNRAEEFLKANITVKAISLEENGWLKESSPLPNFKFKELAEEQWEDSSIYDYFSETKLLYVVFKKQMGCRLLKGCQLWNMPYETLDGVVKEEWELANRTVREGVRLTIKQDGTITNNLLKMKETQVLHIRPHASKSFYVMEDGCTYGSGTIKDADELPDGRWMTKQSFWLNSKYVYSILEEKLK